MRVHIVGAGLAGLSAAVTLARNGTPVRLYEAAPRAGGRCRSYHDTHLDCVIDNGNHLLMSGNTSTMSYLDSIGGRDRLTGPSDAAFPFLDVSTGARWSLSPSRGRIPWWILDADRRVPGTSPISYLSALRIMRARQDQTVADLLDTKSALFRNFWEPLTLAALNTAPEHAAAILMRPVLTETFLRGSASCRPLIARTSLAEALVDPALDLLSSNGAEVRFGCRVRALVTADRRVTGLETDDGPVSVEQDDAVIIAAPPWTAETLVPSLEVPPAGEAIVNVHFRLPPGGNRDHVRIVGIVGGLAQWIFQRHDIVSVTISAADRIAEESAESIAARCWKDAALALNAPSLPEPPSRVIKEKRATFAQTPQAIARRPGSKTDIANLLLAGDWTATGLPATIESAVRSGVRAAEIAAAHGRAGRARAA